MLKKNADSTILVKSVEKILLFWFILVFMFNSVFQPIINTFERRKNIVKL